MAFQQRNYHNKFDMGLLTKAIIAVEEPYDNSDYNFTEKNRDNLFLDTRKSAESNDSLDDNLNDINSNSSIRKRRHSFDVLPSEQSRSMKSNLLSFALPTMNDKSKFRYSFSGCKTPISSLLYDHKDSNTESQKQMEENCSSTICPRYGKLRTIHASEKLPRTKYFHESRTSGIESTIKKRTFEQIKHLSWNRNTDAQIISEDVVLAAIIAISKQYENSNQQKTSDEMTLLDEDTLARNTTDLGGDEDIDNLTRINTMANRVRSVIISTTNTNPRKKPDEIFYKKPTKLKWHEKLMEYCNENVESSQNKPVKHTKSIISKVPIKEPNYSPAAGCLTVHVRRSRLRSSNTME